MVDALRRAGGDSSLIAWKREPAVEAIVGSWPARFQTRRANSLGFPAADDLDLLVSTHVNEHVSH